MGYNIIEHNAYLDSFAKIDMFHRNMEHKVEIKADCVGEVDHEILLQFRINPLTPDRKHTTILGCLCVWIPKVSVVPIDSEYWYVDAVTLVDVLQNGIVKNEL